MTTSEVVNQPAGSASPTRYLFVRTGTGEKRHVAVEFADTTVCGAAVAEQFPVHERPPLCEKCKPHASKVKAFTFEESLQWVREHGGPATGAVASLDEEIARKRVRTETKAAA